MAEKPSSSSQKLRGGYYTPREIAMAITRWAVARSDDVVLEPSFGDGAFVKAIVTTKIHLGAEMSGIGNTVYGTELDSQEFKKALGYLNASFSSRFPNLFNEDFFQWFQRNTLKYDAVVGNPPFIRYQNFPEPYRSLALALSNEQGVKLNKLTNIWVPFLILSISLLKTNGRLGMVIPSELLQVSYAGPLRQHLIDSFANITVVTCNELLFEEAEQEIVIVLANGRKQNATQTGAVEVIKTETKKELLVAIQNHKEHGQERTVLRSTEKWTKYFLAQDQIDFMRALKEDHRVITLGQCFEVDVGVVTGKNDFFIVNRQLCEEYGLGDYVRPAIGRSYQIKNEIFTRKDWEAHWNAGEAVGLLDFTSLNEEIPENVKNYLRTGLTRGVEKGYKCAIRKEWYKVPSIWAPHAFLFRQIHDFPHLVMNEADAVPTDTIHRVRKVKNQILPQTLFYTHLTAASAEIEGRSYGGGVLELEPSEAEKLLIPNPALVDVDKLDYFVIRKENGKFLKVNSAFVLKELLGFTMDEVNMLETIYNILFFRRRSRKKSVMGRQPLVAVEVDLFNDSRDFFDS